MQATEELVATLRKPVEQLTLADLAALDAWLSQAYQSLRREAQRQEAIRESRRILAAIAQDPARMIPWAEVKQKLQAKQQGSMVPPQAPNVAA